MTRSSLARSIIRILFLSAAMVGVSLATPSPLHANDEVTALVPAYFYPTWWSGSPWDQLNAAAPRIPIEAIMNPASGPGTASNSDYVYAVGKLQAAGGKVIGYVDTAYGARSIKAVMADVQSYISFYNVDGIFLDQMGNQNGALDYVAVYNAIKALNAPPAKCLHVVGNPGTPFAPAQSYLTAADTLTIFEGPLTSSDPNGASFKLYPRRGPYAGLPLWFRGVDSSQIANIIYSVPTDCAGALTLLKATWLNAGYVYITDAGLPNPYGLLPSYWNELVDMIAVLNGVDHCD